MNQVKVRYCGACDDNKPPQNKIVNELKPTAYEIIMGRIIVQFGGIIIVLINSYM